MSDRIEVGARPSHPTTTDLVAYAGINLGLALVAFVGHSTSTDLVARPAIYVQTAAAYVPPGFPTQFFGLRVYDNGAVQNLCLVATADAPTGMGASPRVRKGGTIYAVYLVETSDPNASTVRCRTSAGTKAIRLKT